jgi:hypothetical protein
MKKFNFVKDLKTKKSDVLNSTTNIILKHIIKTGEGYECIKDVCIPYYNFEREYTSETTRKRNYQSDLEFVQVEKQFIQMELIVGDIELDIHPYLKDYYYEKNQILDKTFLLWLCNYASLEVPLKEIREGNYTIKIIDKNVEMFDLKSTESIFLIGDSGYKIVPNNTE